jgi:hypothetical protein
MSAAACGSLHAPLLPDIALMSLVKPRGCNMPASPRFPREGFDAMIVQRWGHSLETSVIKL